MAHVFGDRILETSITTGTGSYTVTGAAGSAYATLSTAKTPAGVAIGAGDTFYYKATAVDASFNDTGDYEVGLGTYVSSTVFSRTRIDRSSNADATVSWAAGTKAVSLTAEAQKTLQLTAENCAVFPAVSSEPSAAEAGFGKFYFKGLANEIMPRFKKPDGQDHFLQQIIALNGRAEVRPGSGTGMTVTGSAFTNVGTVSHPVPASTNLATATRRAIFTSASTTGALNSHRQTTMLCWRGNASGLGGFRVVIRMKLDTQATGNRSFFGISTRTSAPINVDPTTSTTDSKIGIGQNASTGNWQFITGLAGAGPTVTDLGASFAISTTEMLDVVLFASPNASAINYEIINRSTGASTGAVAVSANLPASTDFLAPLLWQTNNAQASAVVFSLYQWTIDSDF